ncbi:putative norsolorinic acid reductase protein [Botrytis fragariae]|uniref:Putative norsolorinic acid reductase protein n=1 Tax=Botrytis fragariae TaxID=1964551 RepID=A0A8H6B1T5_9HELO|nr:putative norsolorinic acid reductase protein [Botrytis fragariae]KAF5877856.1 putative norsolorinic acid reductase protein [Botrytis fragariae]
MAPPFPPAPAPESMLFRHRQLAPTANVRVSPICLGAMNFGDADKARLGECNKETSFEILDIFKGLGGNFIDTANGYQAGQSETWLGEWMKSRDCRDEMVLATKYSSPYQKHHLRKIQSNFGGNGTKSLRHSVETSLKRLQTEYIDLLYVHWWDYATTIPELMTSLNDLVSSGKVNYLGVSDTPAWVVAKANQYARDHGLRQFVVYQGLWNAAKRDFERDIVPMCKDEGMGLIPWGTLAQGRFQTEATFKEREKSNPGRQGRPSVLEKRMSKVLESIAASKNTNITSIAMIYIMQKAPYVFPLVGGRKVEHIKGNVEALKLVLTDEDMAKIDRASRFDPGFPHTFLSGSQFGEDQDTEHEIPDGAKDVWLTQILGTFDWVESSKPITPSENR